ncbi:hypothetical protein [Erinnyis ello granulovirus]|uniref:Uncharacterized protein n=1 Tax=Erinnyis ello granulovirus TaxID=307444 RepID=A0A097DAS9_9BBAC|nr:hypothetical protein [Erinnyis ello granulovirus]AIS92093.1 hypothetical protein [Erinnyis ello granulovirus]ARX71433.1 hypothetical protein EREL_094 [Erinnyis ello granulovirus]ARX71563.1 hypothetical protein EREL_094 [Erinnyis ello granulovirus]ARX71693.1 hypothetical protein EREL_094 [Erinnyis ello granulovirus]ARX71823.1 hypothetical protein EREL_094 [Erinnyis ello granulovirus]
MDIIVVVVGDENDVFRSKHEYKLEKTGIPAYKLIVEEGWSDDIDSVIVENEHYLIVVNNVVTGGCVGLLITLNTGVVFKPDDIVFRVKRRSVQKDPVKVLPTNFVDTSVIPEFSSISTIKTSSVFDKYNVESKRK